MLLKIHTLLCLFADGMGVTYLSYSSDIEAEVQNNNGFMVRWQVQPLKIHTQINKLNKYDHSSVSARKLDPGPPCRFQSPRLPKSFLENGSVFTCNLFTPFYVGEIISGLLIRPQTTQMLHTRSWLGSNDEKRKVCTWSIPFFIKRMSESLEPVDRIHFPVFAETPLYRVYKCLRIGDHDTLSQNVMAENATSSKVEQRTWLHDDVSVWLMPIWALAYFTWISSECLGPPFRISSLFSCMCPFQNPINILPKSPMNGYFWIL